MKNNINQILIFRQFANKDNTVGQLYLDGDFIGYTLEDVLRPLNIKVKHETAIEDSTYYANLIGSPTFGRTLWLQDVSNFTEILIHGGNNEDDSSGCILLGLERNKTRDGIFNCRPALDLLLEKLDDTKPVVVTISNAVGID